MSKKINNKNPSLKDKQHWICTSYKVHKKKLKKKLQGNKSETSIAKTWTKIQCCIWELAKTRYPVQHTREQSRSHATTTDRHTAMKEKQQAEWVLFMHACSGLMLLYVQSSGAAWKLTWLSWATIPNKPTVSVDVKQHFNQALWPQRPKGLSGTGSPGRPPRLSHSSWTLRYYGSVLLYVPRDHTDCSSVLLYVPRDHTDCSSVLLYVPRDHTDCSSVLLYIHRNHKDR